MKIKYLFIVNLFILFKITSAVFTIGSFTVLTAASSTGPIGWVFLASTAIALGVYGITGINGNNKDINICNKGFKNLIINNTNIGVDKCYNVNDKNGLILLSLVTDCPLIKLNLNNINIDDKRPVILDNNDYSYPCTKIQNKECSEFGNKIIRLYKDSCVGEKIYIDENVELKNISNVNMLFKCEYNCKTFNNTDEIIKNNNNVLNGLVNMKAFGINGINNSYTAYTSIPYSLSITNNTEKYYFKNLNNNLIITRDYKESIPFYFERYSEENYTEEDKKTMIRFKLQKLEFGPDKKLRLKNNRKDKNYNYRIYTKDKEVKKYLIFDRNYTNITITDNIIKSSIIDINIKN